MAHGNRAERNGASTSVNDALLCTIMCMIDHIVDVHVKDGSIYSGTFYTANVDNGYAIVLKNAKRIKKGGNRKTNVADEKLIDTLVIMSENLVQLIAREVLFPVEGISGRVGEDCVGAVAGIVRSDERFGNAAKHRELNLDKRKKVNRTRHLDPVKSTSYAFVRKTSAEAANQQRDGINFVKRGSAETKSSNERQVADSLGVEQGVLQADINEQAEQRTGELEGSRLSLDACKSHSRPGEKIISGANKVEMPSSVSVDSRNASQASTIISRANKVEKLSSVSVDDSRNASQASTIVALPKKGNHGQATKESKLNPRAQLFSPSLPQRKSITPSVPPAPSMNRSLQPAPMVPTAPAKLAPQNNVFYVNGRGDIPHTQHVVGPMASRTPPVRYAGQYNHLQTGTPYAFPSAQSVMAGRRPLIYVHPVPNDVTQGAGVFSQLPSRPMMAPPDLPKLQATMQFYAAHPSVANGQQTYAMPAFVPALPPVFQVPGLNGSYNTKFA